MSSGDAETNYIFITTAYGRTALQVVGVAQNTLYSTIGVTLPYFTPPLIHISYVSYMMHVVIYVSYMMYKGVHILRGAE